MENEKWFEASIRNLWRALEEGDAHLTQSITNLGGTAGNISARVCELEAMLKGLGIKYDAAVGNGAGGYTIDGRAIRQADVSDLTFNSDKFEIRGDGKVFRITKKGNKVEIDPVIFENMKADFALKVDGGRVSGFALRSENNQVVEGTASELSARIVEAMNLINSEELNNLDSLCAHDKATLQRIVSAVKRALVA